jgi:hypothetical protein
MIGIDGTERKEHYGPGKQPWDTIKELGWGPEFAAGNVLKYLRRDKDKEHSLESARWYYNQLTNLSDYKITFANAKALDVRNHLYDYLSNDELELLGWKSLNA